MSVHRLADGRWYVQWRDGTRIKRRYTGRGLEAEQAARHENAKLNLRDYQRRTPQQQDPTFAELSAAYMTAKTGHMQPSSLLNAGIKLEKIICPAIGHLAAGKITHARLDRYVAARLPDVKRVTIHRELSYITAILNWAVSRRLIHRSPAAGYKPPKRDDDIILPPTQAEVAALLAASDGHLVRALVTSYFTGIRPGRELFRITWPDIDLAARTIMIRSARKGGPTSRQVPVHPQLYHLLQAWDAQDKGKPGHLIHYQGGPVKSIKTAFKQAKTTAKITRRLRPYDFRHAFASKILAAGGDLKSVSEMLGHSRPDTTVRVYQHTSRAMHRQAVDLLPGIDITNCTTKKKPYKHKK